ncbi:MAG TPA: T9SS type A sorting domain-containing protein [Bacteroidia bacterium]|jgi:hypothetical protein|nr:T9SS type A sorting domain-containing protein [Bacteroidia bacterium]
MKKVILIIFIFFATNFYGQCGFTITVSFTAATCSTCCNGVIAASINGFGCVPVTLTLQPLGITNATSTYTNLCPGSYTVMGGYGCCLGTCSVSLPVNATGLNEISYLGSEMIIYPNPVSNTLFVTTNQKGFENYEIINYLGQTVFKEAYKKEIDVSWLSSGCYMLKITSFDKRQYNSKFIKE